MRRLGFIIVLVIISLECASSCTAQNSVEGDWLGEFKVGQESTFIKASFRSHSGDVEGRIYIPRFMPVDARLEGSQGFSLTAIRIQVSSVHFGLSRNSGQLVFDGRINDGAITGEVRDNGKQGVFQLVRLAEVDPRLAAQYAGSYEIRPGCFISLGPFDEADDRLMFVEHPSGRTGILYPLSETTFFSGPSVGIHFPIDIKFSFLKNAKGEVTGLIRSQNGTADVLAARTPFRQEEVSFQNRAITLRGTLTLPVTQGPHPAIVLVHGSGPATRNRGNLPYFYLQHRIAVLAYDKRGTGASTGEWEGAAIEDLADDALAAVRLLRSNAAIDHKQIGLRGDSNGGWVVPLAASKSKDIAFIIVRSASGLRTGENLIYEIENDLRDRGFSDNDVDRALVLPRLLVNAILTNSGWDELSAAIRRARNEKWFELTRVSWVSYVKIPPDSDTLKQLIAEYGFDPIPSWQKVTCPVLVQLGELDKYVPSKESATRIGAALKVGGNKDYTITTYPGGDHGLLETETGFSSEIPRANKYVSQYWESMINWLRKRVSFK
jgi:pimeloyl-ACP methyl ester carboxylesterase